MADNSVFITGATDGAFTAAFSDLPAWATEDTAKSIEKVLRKSLKLQGDTFDQLKKCCTGGGQTDTKKLNDELDNLADALKAQADAQRLQNRLSEEELRLGQQRLAQNRRLDAGTSETAGIFAALVGAGDKVLGVFKQYISTSDELFKAGINVLNGNNSTTNSMEAMNQMVLLTGLRLETLQGVILKYNNTMNAVGVQKFGQAIKKSQTELGLLGYSTEAQAELIATLMETEAGFSDIRNKTADQLSEDAIVFGKQLTELSQTVGISREQLQANIKATAKSSDSTLVAARWGAEAAENVAKATGALKDQNLAKVITQMAAASSPEFTQAYRDLVSSGFGDYAVQLGRIAQESKTLDPVAFQKKIDAFSQTFADGRVAGLQDQIAGGNQAAQATAEIVTALKQAGRNVSQATEPQAAGAVKTQASISALQSELESLSASLQKTFYPTLGQIDKLTEGVSALNNAIEGAINGINSANGDILPMVGATLVVISFTGALVAAIAGLMKFTGSLLGAGGLGGLGGPGGGPGGPGNGPGGGRGRGIRFGIGAIVGGLALDAAATNLEEAGHEMSAAAVDIGSSALTYAGIGALMGSFVPVIGNVVGGAVGGLVGTALGAYKAKDVLFNTKEAEKPDSAAALSEKPEEPTEPKPVKVELEQPKPVEPKPVKVELEQPNKKPIGDDPMRALLTSNAAMVTSLRNSMPTIAPTVSGTAVTSPDTTMTTLVRDFNESSTKLLATVSPAPTKVINPISEKDIQDAMTTANSESPLLSQSKQELTNSGLMSATKPPDINILLGYHSSLLEQLLDSSNRLVSVNQDILRRTIP